MLPLVTARPLTDGCALERDAGRLQPGGPPEQQTTYRPEPLENASVPVSWAMERVGYRDLRIASPPENPAAAPKKNAK